MTIGKSIFDGASTVAFIINKMTWTTDVIVTRPDTEHRYIICGRDALKYEEEMLYAKGWAMTQIRSGMKKSYYLYEPVGIGVVI